VASSSPPLIAIPAALCTGALYPRLDEMAAGSAARVIIPRGAGVGDCATEVLRLAPGSFLLLGTSWGAQIALEVALRAPDRVEGLCLIGVNAGQHPNPAGVAELANCMPGSFDATVEEFANECIHAPADTGGNVRRTFVAMAGETGPSQFADQLHALGQRPDRQDRLGDLTMPVLLLWGEQDRVTPLERARPFVEQAPSCDLKTIANCGHLPTLEQPDAAAVAFRTWRSGVG
jgi:pimeloyl-ACP methyl ester carboxylesterase